MTPFYRGSTTRALAFFVDTEVGCISYRFTLGEPGGQEMARGAGTSRSGRSLSKIRRKNLNVDQTKLDRVKDALGARTETEAIDQALAIVLLREELVEGIRRIAGSGGVENVFRDDEEL
jgi:hypothetical protein